MKKLGKRILAHNEKMRKKYADTETYKLEESPSGMLMANDIKNWFWHELNDSDIINSDDEWLTDKGWEKVPDFIIGNPIVDLTVRRKMSFLYGN